MKIDAEQVLCRFHLSNFIRHGMEPLYQWIVETAHREGLRGATVLKGFHGLRPDGSTGFGSVIWGPGMSQPELCSCARPVAMSPRSKDRAGRRAAPPSWRQTMPCTGR